MKAPKIVLLGLMTKIPVAGVVWQTVHYLLGFQRLGYEPYYVEAHARTPSMLMSSAEDDGAVAAADFIHGVMHRFGLSAQWAYQALHHDGRCYGMSDRELMRLYDDAELIINLHGGTAPRHEHSRSGRLVCLETDPVQLQIELDREQRETIEFLEQHCAFFTFGENWGSRDCKLPPSDRFMFHPTRQPVCLDLWPPAHQTRERFTTVGNWRQEWRDVTLGDQVYTWSKHIEFERVLAMPTRTGARFELALGQCGEEDRHRLARHGWHVINARTLSQDLVRYRTYITGSYGEFTVAKEQNVKLRSGWFSDRSATYLAAGRPVITQETGFSNALPTGTGLHSFSSIDEAIEGVEAVCSNYDAERRAAREIAREYFASEVVLVDLLSRVGLSVPPGNAPRRALTSDLLLTPTARRPLRLPETTRAQVQIAPFPFCRDEISDPPAASVVVVSHDDLVLTRLCLDSVLENTLDPAFEVIVVDNGSRDGSRVYLRTLERRFTNVRVLLNDANEGFPAACNQGLAVARGDVLVLLNSDTIVPPGWLELLVDAVSDPAIGLAGPVTNRIGNEAEIATDYMTYGEFIESAGGVADNHSGAVTEISMPAMFCVALRRDVYERIGPLDERFGPGTLEDDDYAERVTAAGMRSICREDVLVHHFGEGSLGRLFINGGYSRLLDENRRKFERKWGRPWKPYARRRNPDYETLCTSIRTLVESHSPKGAAILVISRGDEELVTFADRQGWHFPQTPDGGYTGHHPSTAREAIAELERLRTTGAGYLLLPHTSRWWLDHYGEFGDHLHARYSQVVDSRDCVMFDLAERR